MPRVLVRLITALAAAGVVTFAVLLIIDVLLFFKLKSMFRGNPAHPPARRSSPASSR